jgi:hypothetical protein
MKAYHFSAIFQLDGKAYNEHGCMIADSEESVKKTLLTTPHILARSCVGYALTHFSCGLIDPAIAPMNKEVKV